MRKIAHALRGIIMCLWYGRHKTIACRDAYGAPYKTCLRCGKVIE